MNKQETQSAVHNALKNFASQTPGPDGKYRLNTLASNISGDYESEWVIDTGNSNIAVLQIKIYGIDPTNPTGSITIFYLDADGNSYTPVGPMAAGSTGQIITTGSGTTDSNTTRVVMALDSPDVTSLSIIDNWDESSRAKVNPIVGQTGVQGGAGVTTPNTQRISISTDANYITGNVGGYVGICSSTITMSVAGSYSTGDYIGTSTTPQFFSNAVRQSGGTGTIKTIRITDKTTTAPVSMELWLFSGSFVAPTDNAAWSITDSEALICLGVIPIDTTKWYSSANNKVYTDDRIAIGIKPSVTSLYYALVARGTTPTWVSGDLDIGLTILQD